MFRIIAPVLIALIIVSAALAQGPRPKEVLLDSAGRAIPNDEWRDCSMSDPLRKDPFTRTVRPDGTVELRLKKNLIEGTPAAPLGIKTIDGKEITAAALKDKVVVVNVWFIGCASCMTEIPKLNELAAKYPDRDRVVFLSLSPDKAAAIAGFTRDVPFNYLHAGEATGAMDALGVKTYPRNIVIGRDGRIVYWRSTVKAWYKFDEAIRDALGKPL